MTEQGSKQVVLRYVDAFNRGDVEALKDLFTDDALVHGVLGWGGLDKVIPVRRELHEAFAIRLQAEAVIAGGDTVAVRYVERGTSVGSFRGKAANGKSYEVVAMEWLTIEGGRIRRRWGRATQAHNSGRWGSRRIRSAALRGRRARGRPRPTIACTRPRMASPS